MATRRLNVLALVNINADSIHQEVLESTALVSDLRPVWTKAGTIMRRSFAANFLAGGRPEKWAPLSPNTVAAKMAAMVPQGYRHTTLRNRKQVRRLQQAAGGNILIVDGALRDSYVQKNINHISRVNKEGFEEGSKHFLAPFHEMGTDPYTIVSKKSRFLRFRTVGGIQFARIVHHPGLPARPVAIFQEEDEAAIAKLIADHVGQ